MLDNYSINKDGLIYQVDKIPFVYNEEYVKVRYDTYGELNKYMSYLRLGYLFGATQTVQIKSILDVGYGNGAFLNACEGSIERRYGYDITGYPIPKGATFIENWNNSKNHFDVITFFDVLEHFEDPYIIKNLNCNYIIISLPWCHYFSDEWFKDWKHRRPNEHLWFFNEKSIHSFANTCGYKVISYTNIEDSIRKSSENYENILTFCLKKQYE